jgi:transposase-like protein
MAEKIRIVSETLLPNESIKSVAERHRLHPNLLASWRRQVTDRLASLFSIADSYGELPRLELQQIGSEIAIDRRQKWSVQDKLRIVIESYDENLSVKDVARRHNINPNQLFIWRQWAGHDVDASTSLKQALGEPGTAAIKRSARHPAIRRDWTLDDKFRILREARKISVSKVAKKYNLNPGQIFRWRRSLESI